MVYLALPSGGWGVQECGVTPAVLLVTHLCRILVEEVEGPEGL